jgi:hypothetical protein
VLIVCIVNNALKVAFVITHLQGQFMLIFHDEKLKY